jgi:hypothetical protein
LFPQTQASVARLPGRGRPKTVVGRQSAVVSQQSGFADD